MQDESKGTKIEETKRELRSDLSPKERERAERRIGDLRFKSHRPLDYRSHSKAYKFIPSRTQH